MKNPFCIIVGSGLAGVSVAWELYKHSVPFLMISNPLLSQSSLIAPGIWNPIVFKRIVPTWNANELIQTLVPFYNYVENKLNKKLLTPFKIWHIINNQDEKRWWLQKREFYPQFLGEIKTFSSTALHHQLECGEVHHCGRLNIPEYLYYSIEFFKSIHQYHEEYFNYQDLVLKETSVLYKNIIAEKIIFCEGYLIKDNPYFQFVKLKPAKGEIIEIETAQPLLPNNTILHKNISIIHHHHNKYFIGSNYEWKDLNETPTETVKQIFLSTFKKIFNVEYQVVGHYAGIRPASDRRPIIGQHPQINNLYILNGLGTKGVMLAPYVVQLLVEHLINYAPIPVELSLNRFLK
ncbi:MAG: FAD-binding oxidoreductase [Bacteroidia bacterium]|nr:FAD-binding oxidoreductase [Bacteroidia bacterium]